MTTKLNEREASRSRTGKKKSVDLIKQVATWILVVFLVVMLLAPLVG